MSQPSPCGLRLSSGTATVISFFVALRSGGRGCGLPRPLGPAMERLSVLGPRGYRRDSEGFLGELPPHPRWPRTSGRVRAPSVQRVQFHRNSQGGASPRSPAYGSGNRSVENLRDGPKLPQLSSDTAAGPAARPAWSPKPPSLSPVPCQPLWPRQLCLFSEGPGGRESEGQRESWVLAGPGFPPMVQMRELGTQASHRRVRGCAGRRDP